MIVGPDRQTRIAHCEDIHSHDLRKSDFGAVAVAAIDTALVMKVVAALGSEPKAASPVSTQS
jgi:hypothetical protein